MEQAVNGSQGYRCQCVPGEVDMGGLCLVPGSSSESESRKYKLKNLRQLIPFGILFKDDVSQTELSKEFA